MFSATFYTDDARHKLQVCKLPSHHGKGSFTSKTPSFKIHFTSGFLLLPVRTTSPRWPNLSVSSSASVTASGIKSGAINKHPGADLTRTDAYLAKPPPKRLQCPLHNMTAPATKARSETATGAKIDGTKDPGAGLEAGVGAGACAITALLIAATTTTATRAARLTAVKVEAIVLMMMKKCTKKQKKGAMLCFLANLFVPQNLLHRRTCFA